MENTDNNSNSNRDNNDTNIPNKIFIVPYRNRLYQKIHFENYMKYIMEDIPDNDYKIFFSHQLDPRPFNRGATKNIGFIAMRNLYPDNYKDINFIFNDVDTMPYEKNLLDFNTTHNTVKHYYGFKFALGGIFSITGSDFEKCGGFPNFWGYGYEDDCIQARILNKNINIDRNNFYPIFDQHILQIHSDPRRILSNQKPQKGFHPDNTLENIIDLTYNIDGNMININNFNIKNYPFNKEHYYYQNLSEKPIVVDNLNKNIERNNKINRFKMKLY